MGTNFYLLKKLSSEKKKEAIKAVEEDNYDAAREILSDNGLSTHIGKRSSGWRFLWNANDFIYFKPNAESLKEWLKSGDIIDEYGRKYTYEQFINEEIGEFLDENLLHLKTYYEKERSREEYYSRYPLAKIDSYGRKFNVSPDLFGEFDIPGGSISSHKLRFTMCTEFC